MPPRSAILALLVCAALARCDCGEEGGRDGGADSTDAARLDASSAADRVDPDRATTDLELSDAGLADARRSDVVAPDNARPDTAAPDAAPPSPRLYLQLDAALGTRVSARVRQLLAARTPYPIVDLVDGAPAELVAGSWLIAIGDVWATRQLVPAPELAALGSEGMVVRSGEVAGIAALVADGNPLEPDPFGHPSLGPIYAGYAALEALGFAFLHPLAPVLPSSLNVAAVEIDLASAPRWPVRGLQIHTMHPLELTDLLQGWGPAGPDDQAGFDAGLSEWASVVEWLVANRQNRVHWPLLEADPWAEFARGDTRQRRLAALTEIAHDFGVAVGADTPIALQQQHSFKLLGDGGTLDEELASIRASLDWLMAAEFDYLATENGTTEFTHPDPARMLAWMDETARYLDETHGAESIIKVHCSQGQVADGYQDEETGEPLNFNFLPHYADPRLGVAPHTVQIYALDDPAPTYGNTDFDYMRRFLRQQAGRRAVLWHPETAYWVSYDVDVPLFLPVYAERRVRDLRLIAADEASGESIQGQLIFSSGWEWGYWLNDVVTARAAWDPHGEVGSDEAALRAILEQALAVAGPLRDDLVSLLLDTAAAQRELLILGLVGGQAPVDIERRSGIAYLQGFDAWDDVMDLGQGLPAVGHISTQPDKLGLVELRNPLHAPPSYDEVSALLSAIAETHGALADRFDLLDAAAAGPAAPLVEELTDAARVTALRATQVEALYSFVHHDLNPLAQDEAQQALARARAALDSAQVLVSLREQAYRVDAARVAGWRVNPTAYAFGYLWTVRAMLYWWRDELKAVEAPLSPCVLNVINPATVGLGEGVYADAARLAQDLVDSYPLVGDLAECLAEPALPPALPPPGLRDGP